MKLRNQPKAPLGFLLINARMSLKGNVSNILHSAANPPPKWEEAAHGCGKKGSPQSVLQPGKGTGLNSWLPELGHNGASLPTLPKPTLPQTNSFLQLSPINFKIKRVFFLGIFK